MDIAVPTILSSYQHESISKNDIHSASMRFYEHGTTMYLLAKDDIVKRFDGKGMAVVGFEVDQVRRTDHGNLDFRADCVGPWFDWTENNVFWVDDHIVHMYTV